MSYSYHRFKVDFRTPPLSPLHADTVFGHLCWALKAVGGEDELKAFLAKMQGPLPPLLLSDMLPRGYLPKRIHADVPDGVSDELKKRLRKMRYVKRADVFDVQKLVDAVKKDVEYAPVKRAFDVTRTAIDRETGKALEGHLFSNSSELFMDGYDLYAAFASSEDKALFVRLISFISDLSGYGADKTCGFGCIAEVSEETVEPEILNKLRACSDRPCLAISGVVPVNLRLSESSYKIRVKYGRLSEEFSVPHPFKKPVAFLDSGSVYISVDASRPAGAMVADVAPQLKPRGIEILQYGYGLGLEL